MTSDESPTEKLPTTPSAEEPDPAAAPIPTPQPEPQPKKRRFTGLRSQAKAAPVLAAILAVLVIGGLGFGAGYLVGGHEHHHGGRGRHMVDGGYARQFNGPGRMDRQGPLRGNRQDRQGEQDQQAPNPPTSSTTPAPSSTPHV